MVGFRARKDHLNGTKTKVSKWTVKSDSSDWIRYDHRIERIVTGEAENSYMLVVFSRLKGGQWCHGRRGLIRLTSM